MRVRCPTTPIVPDDYPVVLMRGLFFQIKSAHCLHAALAVSPEEHFMIGSNVTRRRMIGGLAAGVSAAAVISSDTFIGSARAQSARKTFILVPGAFTRAWCCRR